MKAIGAKLMRLTATGAACGIVGIFVIYTAWRFLFPYAEELRTRREVTLLQQRVGELQAEHRKLEQQAQLLQTPEGMKIEARRLGMLKAGERSLRFMARPQPREAAAAQPKAPAPRTVDRVKAWGRSLLEKPAEPATGGGKPPQTDRLPR